MDIYEAISKHGAFQGFLASIKVAGAEDVLKRPGEWTLFAPTDAAFAKLPQRTLDSLLRSRENMAEFISFHMLPGRIQTADVKNMPTREELQGKRFAVSRGKIQVNGARVVEGDIQCANGVLHAIDGVLMPTKIGIS